MVICKNCGVELEAGMENCPLCGQPANGATGTIRSSVSYPRQLTPQTSRMTAPQKKFTWEIISLVLLSAIVATFIIDFIINRKMTWSEYPAAISLIIFSYVSLLAFWQQRLLLQLSVGFVLSSASIILIDAVTAGVNWALALGLPILLAINLIVILLITIIRTAKYKGVNLLAWAFMGAGILCVCIEGILSYYRKGSINLMWSIIVGGSVVPVALVLVFVHFRLKRGRNLKRTFHI
jgi:hypothetical protein